MREIFIAAFMFIGTFFMFVAALGVVRMPDLFMRLSTTTKAATLGAMSLLLATAFYFDDFGISGRIAAIIAFIVLTAPVAAHMIGRAAYFSNVPLWKGTICDELRNRYDTRVHILKDPAANEETEKP
ncbi:MAG: monovalent cation/H(+) antiporter subunit G [Deltaproteobacteria bacterium]|nr:monovalent cation/H(+) antiporter subunit G [Deltaproteobacteria bacterium]TLN04315.1 MAG: monovalent cation/H(+) antiporter subunit G [bacterium]